MGVGVEWKRCMISLLYSSHFKTLTSMVILSLKVVNCLKITIASLFFVASAAKRHSCFLLPKYCEVVGFCV